MIVCRLHDVLDLVIRRRQGFQPPFGYDPTILKTTTWSARRMAVGDDQVGTIRIGGQVVPEAILGAHIQRAREVVDHRERG